MHPSTTGAQPASRHPRCGFEQQGRLSRRLRHREPTVSTAPSSTLVHRTVRPRMPSPVRRPGRHMCASCARGVEDGSNGAADVSGRRCRCGAGVPGADQADGAQPPAPAPAATASPRRPTRGRSVRTPRVGREGSHRRWDGTRGGTDLNTPRGPDHLLCRG